MAATERMEFRLTVANRARIARAAELSGEPLTAFARTAAEERAERVLRAHEATTVVPEEFFDDLMAALDAPARPSRALIEAASQLRESVVSD